MITYEVLALNYAIDHTEKVKSKWINEMRYKPADQLYKDIKFSR